MLLFLLLCFISCKETKTDNQQISECIGPAQSTRQAPIQTSFIRIDKLILESDSQAAIEKVLQENPLYLRLYVTGGDTRKPMPAAELKKMLLFMAKEPHLDSLMRDYEKKIDVPALEKQLLEVFKNIKTSYPDFKVPEKVYFSVSGFGSFPINAANDLFISEKQEILVIGLDYFLGTDYKYPLPEVPAYFAKRYVARNIPAFVAQMYSSFYNRSNPSDKTLLGDMLFYAKSYYFMQSVVHCLPDSVVLGYSPTQMDYIKNNKDMIWKHYIDKKLFFESSPRIKKDYIDESPFTLPIAQECPGAIARWSGLQMLKKLAQKKKLDLVSVMKLEDAQYLLSESGYKGQ